MGSTSRWVTESLQGVDLAAPESVTLAGTSGRFAAIVSNTLDVPVTVQVRAVADPAMKITGGETIKLAPHGQTSVLLKASTKVSGVHDVTLQLTNQSGQPLGSQDTFPAPCRAGEPADLGDHRRRPRHAAGCDRGPADPAVPPPERRMTTT